MATKKMTFTLPEELVASFTRRVGPSRRSKYVADAIEESLRQREEMIKRACVAANEDPETREIQADFDAIPDMTDEAWDDSPAR